MKYAISLLLACLTVTCRRDDTLLGGGGGTYTPIPQLHRIEMRQTSYDSLHISNAADLILPFRSVQRVVLGAKISGVFVGQDSMVPSYSPQGNSFKLLFSFTVPVESTAVFDSLTLRYVLSDSSTALVDTVAALFKYPYASAEFLFRDPGISVQDLDLTDSVVFLHPYGPEGLYRYNPLTNDLRELLGYLSGDYIAYDSIYVFCDVNHDHVWRFNLLADSVDQRFDATPYVNGYIGGLESLMDTLYLLTDKNTIEKFTMDLQHIQTLPYMRSTLGTTIAGGILYSNDYTNSRISRFNLGTNTFISDVRYPTKYTDALRTDKGILYFTDFNKKFVGRLPVADLTAIP